MMIVIGITYGVKNGVAIFVGGLMFPMCTFLVVAAIATAAKDPAYWRR